VLLEWRTGFKGSSAARASSSLLLQGLPWAQVPRLQPPSLESPSLPQQPQASQLRAHSSLGVHVASSPLLGWLAQETPRGSSVGARGASSLLTESLA